MTSQNSIQRIANNYLTQTVPKMVEETKLPDLCCKASLSLTPKPCNGITKK